MQRLSIIIIGDEILIGQVTDTNSGAIARTFGPEGWSIERVTTVPDDAEAIFDAIDEAMRTSDLVIATGGLGPTKDDITKTTLLRYFGGELRHDANVAANVSNIFMRRGLKMNTLTQSQAMVPTSCRVIQNRFGTAPIMLFERDGKVLVSMPGVPFETEGSLPIVLDEVRRIFSPDSVIRHATRIVTGITESDLSEMLEEFESTLDKTMHLAYLPASPVIRLRLDGHDTPESEFNEALKRLDTRLGSLLIYKGDASVAQIALEAVRARRLTLATAESCTGGNIAHAITSIAGSSDVYVGGVVSYSNDVKSCLLNVPAEVIERHGAVSREVVELMAMGACRATGATCAVATSGIAGPGGGTPEKPVGTVWTAACIDGRIVSRLLHLPGNRQRVIARATDETLLLLIKNL